MYFAKKKKKKGFTLIELLVVIAIIGILATIVIVNVNSARAKAQDTAVKGTMENLRASAELFYDNNNGTYAAYCSEADITKARNVVVSASGIAAGSSFYCTSTGADAWAAYGRLRTVNQFWCVNQTGASATTSATSAVAACP